MSAPNPTVLLSFVDLLKRAVAESPSADLFEGRRGEAVSLVALVLDSTAVGHMRRFGDGHKMSEFAVIKDSGAETKVLYTLVAPSKEIAFYMMCLDASSRFNDDPVAELDPEYRTLDVVQVLQDVGDRAAWDVGSLWQAFVDFGNSEDVYPYAIVSATRDHWVPEDVFQYKSA